MKRTLLVFLLVNLVLSACAPVSAPTPTPAPSATPLPTATLSPTATPTPAPTATPTPIPTIQVGDLSVPDPRVNNPELFDLRNPDAPIPQFVNAMKRAGIEITEEQVAQGITYEALKDKDGNAFVIAVYNLAPSLFPEQYRDLAGPIPLIIVKRGENGRERWESFTLKESDKLINIPIGTLVGGYGDAVNYQKIVNTQISHFSGGAVNFGWSLVQPLINRYNYNPADSDVNNILRKMDNQQFTIGMHVVTPIDVPDWLKQLSSKDVKEAVETRVMQILKRYGSLHILSLVNEYNHPNGDFFLNKLGNNYYLEIFRLARQHGNNQLLMYNDFDNHSSNGKRAKLTKDIVEELKKEGLVDLVGIEFNLHVNDPFDKEDVVSTLRSYGLPVVITEANVKLGRIENLPISERLLKQAQLYQQMYRACVESGVCIGFNTLQIGDKYSVFEQPHIKEFYNPNNDPTLFDDDLQPKLAYYAILSVILNFSSR